MTQFTVHIASGLWIKGFNAVGGLCNLHYFSKSFIFYIAKQQSHLLIGMGLKYCYSILQKYFLLKLSKSLIFLKTRTHRAFEFLMAPSNHSCLYTHNSYFSNHYPTSLFLQSSMRKRYHELMSTPVLC